MKNVNNIDSIFQSSLNNYDSAIPNGLFDKIEAKRGWQPKAMYHLRTKGWAVLLLLILGAYGLKYFSTAPITAPIDGKEPNMVTKTVAPLIAESTNEKTSIQAISPKEKEPIIATKKVSKKELQNNIFTKKINPKKEDLKPTVIADSPMETNIVKASFTKEEKTIIETNPSVNPVQEAPDLTSYQKSSFGLLKNDIQPLNRPLVKLPKGPDGCYDFGKRKTEWRFSVDAMASPDMVFKTLSPRNNDNAPGYQNTREATEELWYAYSAGIRLSAQMDNGIAIRAGVNYSQINESFKYENERETQITINIVRDQDGNIISSDTLQQTGVRYIEHYNRYQQVDVPVMLGYDLEMGRFSVGLNAGAYFNILFAPKGRFLAADGIPTYFTPGRPDATEVFNDNLGISLYGALAINYHLNDRLDLFVEPHFKYQLDPITVAGYELDQNFNTGGIFTGVRFYFD